MHFIVFKKHQRVQNIHNINSVYYVWVEERYKIYKLSWFYLPSTRKW